ncbi:MAG: hypothetical protein ABEK50_04975 [bacterium]
MVPCPVSRRVHRIGASVPGIGSDTGPMLTEAGAINHEGTHGSSGAKGIGQMALLSQPSSTLGLHPGQPVRIQALHASKHGAIGEDTVTGIGW